MEAFSPSMLAERGIAQWSKGPGLQSLQEWWNKKIKMWVNFLCRLLFPYPFHPSFTTVTHKRSQKCRWQVTAHASYICIFEWNDIVNWCMVAWCAQNLHQDGSSFRWHQPCNNQIVLSLHHFVGYWKMCYNFILFLMKDAVSHSELYVTRAQWVSLRAENSAT